MPDSREPARVILAGMEAYNVEQDAIIISGPEVPMTAVTNPQRAESHSQHVLQQALSFCRRHKQPLALLAIDLQELKTLQAEIGEHHIAPLLGQFCEHLNSRKRCEDILITARSNQVVFLALPGTNADGADIAAARLLDWLDHHEFKVDDFRVTLNVRIAVHVHSGADNEGTGRLVNDTLKLLRQPAERGQRILSPQAQKQQSQQAQTQDDTQQNEANPPQALSDTLLAQARKDGLLDTLTPFINALDESARLELVDHLLDASTRTTSTAKPYGFRATSTARRGAG